MVIGDKAAFRHRHIDTVNLLTIRYVVISDTARSELWQEAIASNKDVDGSAGYPATPIATKDEKGSKHQRASGNRDHAEPGPMLTSRCLDPVPSLIPPLV